MELRAEGLPESKHKKDSEEAMSTGETSGEEDEYGGTDGGSKSLGGTRRRSAMKVEAVCGKGKGYIAIPV
eukprot:1159272-Pelagomonas_calceolata.AAC.5